jgi:cytochrome P450
MNRYLATAVRTVAIQALLLRERLETGVAFNPISPRLRQDPYRTYRKLRTKDPVHRSRLFQGWILTRHADVQMVLRDPRFSAVRSNGNAAQQITLDETSHFYRWFSTSLLSIDPPDHTRLRTLVNKAFTPRAVEAMRPRIEQLVAELLDAVEARGEMDVIRDLAYPLPVIVIAEMLGVPPEDRERFKGWSDDQAEGLDPLLSPEQMRRADTAALEIGGYFREIIAERRKAPREDLISALIAVHEQGDALSEDEMLATSVLLLAAGNETTTNLIGNGLLALLRNPEQLRRLRDDPELIESAVEELLRYDSPVQMTDRIAMEDVVIGGKQIRKGEDVAVLLGAANHDPELVPNPDRLDIGRTGVRHVSFGYGVHFCLGAPLARVEGAVALEALIRRMRGLRLATRKPEWRPTITLRGLKSLPVTFEPVRRAAEGAVEEREAVAAGSR